MMHNPPHPGTIVLEDCIKPLGVTITEAAKALGVTRKALSELVNEKSGISADMAVRLSKVFGSTTESWIRLQARYDLWHAEQRMRMWKPTRNFLTHDSVVP